MKEGNGKTDFQAFEKLITDYQDQLFRFAFLRTGSFADSQDIVQDVFVKLYKHPKYPEHIQNIKAYLIRSISNACCDYYRVKKKNVYDPIDKKAETIAAQGNGACDHLLLAEEYERIRKLLKELPAEQAEAIQLRVLDNLSFVEIAELLSLAPTTVKSRFKYGMDKLKNILHSQKFVYEQ